MARPLAAGAVPAIVPCRRRLGPPCDPVRTPRLGGRHSEPALSQPGQPADRAGARHQCAGDLPDRVPARHGAAGDHPATGQPGAVPDLCRASGQAGRTGAGLQPQRPHSAAVPGASGGAALLRERRSTRPHRRGEVAPRSATDPGAGLGQSATRPASAVPPAVHRHRAPEVRHLRFPGHRRNPGSWDFWWRWRWRRRSRAALWVALGVARQLPAALLAHSSWCAGVPP